MQEKLALLQEEMARMQAAADYLAYSMTRCQDLIGWHERSMEEMERLESLTSRFARLADLSIQRIFRLIDNIELTGASTVLDRIYRAEKRGFGAASDIIKIRELRNIIAHEYNGDKMGEIYHVVATLSPALLVIVARTIAYVRGHQFVSS